jgi:hypothetical protein
MTRRAKFISACSALCGVAILVPVIHAVRFPATIRSQPSPDGRLVALVTYEPAFSRSWFDKFNDLTVGVMACRVYCSVKEAESDKRLFEAPLNLDGDMAADYRETKIEWDDRGCVTFHPYAGREVTIDTLQEKVDSKIPEKSGEPVRRSNLDDVPR